MTKVTAAVEAVKGAAAETTKVGKAVAIIATGVYGGLLKAGFNAIKSRVVSATATTYEEARAEAQAAYDAVKASYLASTDKAEQDLLFVKLRAAHDRLMAAEDAVEAADKANL